MEKDTASYTFTSRLSEAEATLKALRIAEFTADSAQEDEKQYLLQHLQEAEAALQKLRRAVEQRSTDQTSAPAMRATLQQEIGKREQAETALEESQALFSSFMQHSPATAFMKDAAGRYLYINAAFEQLFHTRLASCIGKTDFDLYPSAIARQLQTHDVSVLTQKKPLTIEERTKHNGKLRHWVSCKFPLQDATGQSILAGMSIDITARKQVEKRLGKTEKRLEASEDRFAKAFDNAAIGMAILQPDGAWLQVNQALCTMLGYTPDEFLKTTFQALTHPDDIAADQGRLQRLLAGELPFYETEKRYLHKNGQIVWVQVSVALVQGAQDTHPAPVLVIAQIQDMSARKRAEAKLLQSERLAALGMAAAKLAHEIGNPLNGMATTIQLLERTVTKQSESDQFLREPLHDLRTETDRLRALLNDLRTFAQPQLNLRPTPLAAVIQAVLTSEISHYQTHQVSIIQDCAPDLPLVQADGERLTQVVLNLCKNALEAMPEGGTLSVRSYRQGAQVVLHIQDTGQGIPDDVEDIFLPFRTTKAKGTGLGLAIVKQLVDAHGGEIEWESEVGQGTTFTLRLPIAAGEGEEA